MRARTQVVTKTVGRVNAAARGRSHSSALLERESEAVGEQRPGVGARGNRKRDVSSLRHVRPVDLELSLQEAH